MKRMQQTLLIIGAALFLAGIIITAVGVVDLSTPGAKTQSSDSIPTTVSDQANGGSDIQKDVGIATATSDDETTISENERTDRGEGEREEKKREKEAKKEEKKREEKAKKEEKKRK